jgi:CAAX protease family protein
MDSSLDIVALVAIGLTIYIANREDMTGQRGPLLRRLLLGIVALIFFYGLMVLSSAILPVPPEPGNSLPAIDPTAATASFALTAALCLIAWRTVVSLPFRQQVKRWLGEANTYTPESSVHTTAIVLSLVLLALTFEQLVLSGGLSGLAQDVQTNGVSGELFFNALLWVMAALLGVGFALRRTWAQSLQRLGLRVPNLREIIAGALSGLALYVIALPLLFLWSVLVSPDVFAQQTAASEQMAQSINTLPLAFAISIAVAVGEEIFFRGALQPVFGIVPTSMFFALIHSQYTLTPATLLILIVAFGLGLVRNRWGTSSAIICHFVYNFVQFALVLR